jgi:xylulokinase
VGGALALAGCRKALAAVRRRQWKEFDMPENLFLGLDLGTQSLTAVAVDIRSGGSRQASINFDRSYPAYGTRGGVPVLEDPLAARVDPLMWLEALDDLLGMLWERGWTKEIAAVGVSAQQHGTVYLNAAAEDRLKTLDPDTPLPKGLSSIFSRKTCPIWMDSSTGRQCREITAALGGEREVLRLTGSAATERFAGPQIRKFWQEDPQAYAATAHIAFVSSFVTSLLAGRLAPVDAGDGYGANLADIRRGAWSPAAIKASAPGLEGRLPALVTRDDVLGPVSAYMAARFGFRPETEVVVGSGDNPCSLVGLGLLGASGVHAISLGTSDTYFGHTDGLRDAEHTEGHIFGAADGGAMFLVCFKNGSLARAEVKDAYGLTWEEFSDILLATPPGNNGRVMLPYFQPEITPRILEAGVRRFGGLSPEDVRGNVRAVAEAQAMSMFLHSDWTGPRPASIRVTAGGSENRGLLAVIAQVFGVEVHTLEVKESAALGAAIRAARGWLARRGRTASFRELHAAVVTSGGGLAVRPAAGAEGIYRGEGGLLQVFAACERFACRRGGDPAAAIELFRSRWA